MLEAALQLRASVSLEVGQPPVAGVAGARDGSLISCSVEEAPASGSSCWEASSFGTS